MGDPLAGLFKLTEYDRAIEQVVREREARAEGKVRVSRSLAIAVMWAHIPANRDHSPFVRTPMFVEPSARWLGYV